MTNTQPTTNNSTHTLASLGAELSRIGKALITVSLKMQKLTGPKSVRVTKKTDPEMFTKEFRQTVRKSREDIKKGRVFLYSEFRKQLGL